MSAASVLLCVACAQDDRQPDSLGPRAFSFPQATLIAHALGIIDGRTYTNSLDALERSLSLGARFLEVDLSFTADGDLVCFHTEQEDHLGFDASITEVTTDEFLGRRFDGRFTVMTLETLVRRLQPHADTVLITDCKHEFTACMDEVIDVVASVDPAFLRRVVPQFYTSEQWLDVARMEAEHGPFATVIYTLYWHPVDDAAVVEVASRRSVPVVTMSTQRFNPELVAKLADENVAVLTHTINSPSEIVRHFDQGVRGVYSDRFFTWESVERALISADP